MGGAGAVRRRGIGVLGAERMLGVDGAPVDRAVCHLLLVSRTKRLTTSLQRQTTYDRESLLNGSGGTIAISCLLLLRIRPNPHPLPGMSEFGG